MNKGDKKASTANVPEEVATITTINQDDSQPSPFPEPLPVTDEAASGNTSNSPADETAADTQPAPSSKVKSVINKHITPSKAQAQSIIVEPKNQETLDSLYEDSYMYHSFTLSKPLTEREVMQIRRHLDKHDAYKRRIEESRKVSLDGKGKQIIVDIKGYEYSDRFLLDWRIKEHRDISCNYKDYILDIIIEPALLVNLDNLSYDGDSLKVVMEQYIEEAGRMSPILEDLTSCKLSHIEYSVILDIDTSKCPIDVIKYLLNRSNLPADYNEWEWKPFDANSSKKRIIKGDALLGSRSVKMKRVTSDASSIFFKIQRKFEKDYSLEELLETDSPSTKTVIEQMLSDDYAKKSAAIYLMTAIMEGSYYSMERAVEIINSKNLCEEMKRDLIKTLKFITLNDGIHNAKFSQKNTDVLFIFNEDLHSLIDLGINPVTIPEEYEIQELSNPITEFKKQYYNQIRDKKESSLHLEIEENIGSMSMLCQSIK